MTYNALIYGKSDIERIVCIEPTDEGTEIFIENSDGFVTSQILPNEYWLLSDRCLDQYFNPLKGKLYYKWIKTYKSRKAFTGDRSRYKNEDIFSIWNSKESYMVREGLTYFKGLKPEDVSTLAFDIETTTLEHNTNAQILLISNTFFKLGKLERKLFAYDEYTDQGEMLQAWSEWVREKDPSILLGHNIVMFDLPYVQHIAKQFGVQLLLGRNDTSIEFDDYTSQFRKDATNFYEYHKAHIYGREIIDTLFLSYKYDIGRKYETYALKNIIKQEDLEIKDRPFYDASKIRHNYKNLEEWIKIKNYSRQDADDALNLYWLMSPSYFYLTQSVARGFQHVIESATGGWINTIMNRAYLQQGHSIPKVSQSEHFEGAISFGESGLYSNVYKIDISSLYPNIMIQFEVYDKEKDPNAYFLELVKIFTDKRLEYKKLAKTDKYYDHLQAAFKIFANSCYGFLGSSFNNFNYKKGAAFITEQGRKILTFTIDWAKAKGFKIANGDTDSIAFCYPDFKEISENEQKALLKEINDQLPERIKYEPDGYFRRMIVLRAKNYILYDGQKITYKGSAVKATSKEKALQQFIKDLLQAMLDGDYDFVGIYNKYIKEIMDIKDIHRWATKKTITQKVLGSDRTNEKIVREAINGSEYVEGDKAYFFYKADGTLSLVENFSGNYDKDRLLSKLFETTSTFDTVIDRSIFLNYKLKKNKELLEVLLKS